MSCRSAPTPARPTAAGTALAEAPQIVAAPGQRFVGRHADRPLIAGTTLQSEHAVRALRSLLGGAARLLSNDEQFVIDQDCCRFRGRPLTSRESWQPVVELDAFAQVEGAFVLAFRAADGSVTLVRDAIGHRSLYYTVAGGELWFASSLRALLTASGRERRLDMRSLAAFLAYAYVPGRETLLEGVFELLPGERLRFASGELTRRQYWELPAEPDAPRSEEELLAELQSALEREVRALLPVQGPVAASLSGGIDSSLVVALAKQLHSAPVHTFSITFGRKYKDELPFSSLVAKHCDSVHRVVELTPAAIEQHVDDTMACLDKPNGDPLTVPNALLFREMAAHSQVALNGEGGDPCFGGPKNMPMLLSELYGDLHDDRDLRQSERNYLRAHFKCFDELPDLLQADALAAGCTPPLEDDLEPWFVDRRWHSLVARLTAINIRYKGGHHILPKVDALSAPFGVRARSPLFGKALVELACAIPAELKLRGSVEKYILKRVARELLPDVIVDRPKSGMLVPVEGWFQGPLLSSARQRILDGLASLGVFQRPYLERLLRGELGGLRPRRGVKIWLLVSLEAHWRSLSIAADV